MAVNCAAPARDVARKASSSGHERRALHLGRGPPQGSGSSWPTRGRSSSTRSAATSPRRCRRSSCASSRRRSSSASAATRAWRSTCTGRRRDEQEPRKGGQGDEVPRRTCTTELNVIKIDDPRRCEDRPGAEDIPLAGPALLPPTSPRPAQRGRPRRYLPRRFWGGFDRLSLAEEHPKRELENAIERAAVITVGDLHDRPGQPPAARRQERPARIKPKFEIDLENSELPLLPEAGDRADRRRVHPQRPWRRARGTSANAQGCCEKLSRGAASPARSASTRSTSSRSR